LRQQDNDSFNLQNSPLNFVCSPNQQATVSFSFSILQEAKTRYMSLKITGRLPSGKYLQQLKQSPNYKQGTLQNLSPTPMKPEGISYWKMMREFFKKHPETVSAGKIPFVKNTYWWEM